MNRRQFVVKVSIIVLAMMSNVVSFGMIIQYKNKDHKKRVQADCQRIASSLKAKRDLEVETDLELESPFDIIEIKIRIMNKLDNPITFGQTNKENHSLVKYEGLRNLEWAYQNKDPNFVLSHYVPILPVYRYINKTECRFDVINPYNKTFYASNNELEENICSLGKKRLQQFTDQKKVKYGYRAYLGSNGYEPEDKNSPLTLTALFGSQQDIEKALQEKIDIEMGNQNPIVRALYALISNPGVDSNNNALELLFKDPRALHLTDDPEWKKMRGVMYYEFLNLSRQMKNKKAFEIFVTQDIYDSKNLQWPSFHMLREEHSSEPITALDAVIKHNKKPAYEPFSAQDIALLKEHGAKTTLASDNNSAICTIF